MNGGRALPHLSQFVFRFSYTDNQPETLFVSVLLVNSCWGELQATGMCRLLRDSIALSTLIHSHNLLGLLVTIASYYNDSGQRSYSCRIVNRTAVKANGKFLIRSKLCHVNNSAWRPPSPPSESWMLSGPRTNW